MSRWCNISSGHWIEVWLNEMIIIRFIFKVMVLGSVAFVPAVIISSCSQDIEPAITKSPTVPPTPTAGSVFIKPEDIPVYTYRIINTYPHDPGAFTQGLVYEDGVLFEGTGLYGQSSLRRVDLESGDVLQIYELPDKFFGEGITVFGDEIVQLTWKSGQGFVYDKASFELLRTFEYPTEGWGLTHDGEQLIMSDGTSVLHFIDPDTYEATVRIDVIESIISSHVPLLNELEYVNGEIYANVWTEDRIARIDPATGQVVGWIDLTGLLGPEYRIERVDVLNGIAYDTEGGRLFVTGKWWPKLFEIELILQE